MSTCEWFARCGNPAAGLVHHPVLGYVPTCQRCTDKLGLALLVPTVEPVTFNTAEQALLDAVPNPDDRDAVAAVIRRRYWREAHT